MLLALTLVLGMGTAAFAETEVVTSHGEKLLLTKLEDDSYLMSNGNETAVMKVEENTAFAKLTINDKEGENYFYIDKKANTVYSSYTGKTISVEKNQMQPMANGDVVASKTYKVSYKQLANLVSDTSNSFSIASAIITLVAAASGVNIATGAAVVVALISGSLTVIAAGIQGASPSHGVKVTVNTEKIQRHQGGNVVTAYRYVIASVGTY